MMADVRQILLDPNFQQLPDQEKQKVLERIDPNFSTLPDSEKTKVFRKMAGHDGQAQPEETVEVAPEWAGGHPNLYGAYGAGKETLETLFRATKNAPASVGRMLKDMIVAVSHPIETGKAVGNLAIGTGQKLIPGEQKKEKYPEAVLQSLLDRYGSFENFQETVATDPAGVATDIASLLLGSGAAIRGAGTAANLDRLVGAGRTIQKAGATVEPLGAVGRMAGKTGQKLIGGRPNKMYRSAAKFSTVLPEKQKRKMAETALDNEIMPTEKGMNRLQGKIDALNEKIVNKIDNLTTSGETVDSEKIFKYLDDLRQQTNLSDDPNKNLKAINRIEQSIRDGIERQGSRNLTPQELQKLKQRLYRGARYENRPRAPEFADTTKKQIARAAKEELESLYPDLKYLNAQDGDLLELVDAINRSAGRVENLNAIGIGVPIKMGAGSSVGYWVGGPTGAGIGAGGGLLAGILDTPSIKAKLAIALNKAKKAKLEAKVGRAAVRSATAQSGRLTDNPLISKIQ
jgi:polyhydroxyalkanoate synthesis regulator phasin